MFALLAQVSETSQGVPALAQYGAVGLIAILCLGGAIYSFRRFESMTTRFIDYLETKGSKDAELHAAVALALTRVEQALERVAASERK